MEDGSNDPKVDWVSEFTKSTGCKVEAKTFGTSDEALNLMKTGDYDVVSASGDASLRLIASGDVVEVNTKLLKNYDGIFPFLKDRAWNTVDGKHYGVPHGYGANLLMYNTETFPPTAPTSWDVVFDKASEHKGKITAYDSPIYIADAALYLMAHKPELKITNPTPSTRSSSTRRWICSRSSVRTSASTGATTSRRCSPSSRVTASPAPPGR